MGGSFRGSAAAEDSVASQLGELVIIARCNPTSDDHEYPHILGWFDRAPEPKKLISSNTSFCSIPSREIA
jgi:hypothetical protein